MLKLKTRKCGN